MLNRSASLAMSTSVLKALPGKLDIERNSPSILFKRTNDNKRSYLLEIKVQTYFGLIYRLLVNDFIQIHFPLVTCVSQELNTH